MKKLFTICFLSAFALGFSQSKREKELIEVLKKSYYTQMFDITDHAYTAKKYACLEKYYKVNPLKEKEFLSKKNYVKQYPDYEKEPDLKMYDSTDPVLTSRLQEALKSEHWVNNKNMIFPKCIKENDIH